MEAKVYKCSRCGYRKGYDNLSFTLTVRNTHGRPTTFKHIVYIIECDDCGELEHMSALQVCDRFDNQYTKEDQPSI